jgi:hypothetical protein
MPLHILLCDEVLMYFILCIGIIWCLNLFWIQMSLQYIKRFENKNGFTIFSKALGQNPATGPAWPSSLFTLRWPA